MFVKRTDERSCWFPMRPGCRYEVRCSFVSGSDRRLSETLSWAVVVLKALTLSDSVRNNQSNKAIFFLNPAFTGNLLVTKVYYRLKFILHNFMLNGVQKFSEHKRWLKKLTNSKWTSIYSRIAVVMQTFLPSSTNI